MREKVGGHHLSVSSDREHVIDKRLDKVWAKRKEDVLLSIDR